MLYRRPPRTWGLLPGVLLALVGCLPLHPAGVSPAVGQALPSEALGSLRARNIGPVGVGGPVTAIDVWEAHPQLLYLGTASGGVWKSENGGQTWEGVWEDAPVQSIGAVAVFQADPEIVWVGTGGGRLGVGGGPGAGLYKSSDGGRTWTFLGMEETEGVQRIVLHPADPLVAYLGVLGSPWGRGDAGGVYRTRDGGETWSRVLRLQGRTGVGELRMDPFRPERLLAAAWEVGPPSSSADASGTESGLYLSEDGGEIWTRLSPDDGLPPGELGWVGVAVARGEPGRMTAWVEGGGGALLGTRDGGRTWATEVVGIGRAQDPIGPPSLVTDPADGMRLYRTGDRLLVSRDGGKSWGGMAQSLPPVRVLRVGSADGSLLYAGTDRGLYVSRDRGARWAFVTGLPVAAASGLSLDQGVPFRVFVGVEGQGTWRGPSDVWERGGIVERHWERLAPGDGYGTLLDPSDPGAVFAVDRGGGLTRLDLRTGEGKSVGPWVPDAVALRFQDDAPLVADPFDPKVLYFGSQFVHKTIDGGRSWQIISGDLSAGDPRLRIRGDVPGPPGVAAAEESRGALLSIAPSPVEREVVWVGTDDGRVHLTRSGGGDWEEVGRRIRGAPQGAWVSHIEASTHSGAAAYVVFDDHLSGNGRSLVFRTEDYGREWRNLAGASQIQGIVHVLKEDPLAPQLLFAGTERGLYVSFNRGDNWLPWRFGLPAVPVRSVAIHPRDQDLVIGTGGRGIYVLDDIRPLRALARDPGVVTTRLHLFPAPPAYLRSVPAGDGDPLGGDAIPRGEARKPGALLTFWVGGDVVGDTAVVEVMDVYGEVVHALSLPVRPGLNRVSWDLRQTFGRPPGEVGESGTLPLPEALPEPHRVRVTLGDLASEQDLQVLPDPRVDISLGERLERVRALRQAIELEAFLQAIQARTGELRGGMDQAERILAVRGGEAADLLLARIRSLREALSRAERELDQVASDRTVLSSLGRTRDAPTEAERIALFRMEEGAQSAADVLNELLGGPALVLRQALQALGIEVLPEIQPVARDASGEGRDGPRGGYSPRLPPSRFPA